MGSAEADGDTGQQVAITGTRLDRLFALLEVGSNTLTRKTAAQQIGEVQKYHPHELQNLLFRLRRYLHQKNWDTRTAAGQAVEYICQNVKPFNPNWDPDAKEVAASTLESEHFRVALRFSNFNLLEIIDRGQHLLSSGGNEFEMDIDMGNMDPKARIEIQKKRLLKRLGFDKKIDCGIEHIFKDEDFEMQKTVKVEDSKKTAAAVVSAMENLSSRELNRLKRLEKRKGKGSATSRVNGGSANAKSHTPQTIVSESVTDPSLADLHTEWPFMAFAEQLLHDLFDPIWEVRHGAGVGLRTVLHSHGRYSGMSVATATDNEGLAIQHSEWVEDCAIRFLCVLALDKFSDYSSGQAVCPVRETCSQALGVLMQHAPNKSLHAVVDCLLVLSGRDEWELRHSGYLALKYVFAVRQDFIESSLTKLIPSLIRGLKDQSDDVRAIVSDSVQPIVSVVVEKASHAVPALVSALWSAISEYDDLSAATSSVLQALAQCYSHCGVASIRLDADLSEYIPRIWPCLFHSSPSVRLTALNTLRKIATLSKDDKSWFTPSLGLAWLRTQFQALLFEDNPEAVEKSISFWRILVERIHQRHPATLSSSSSRVLTEGMIALSVAGPNEALDPRYLLNSSHDNDQSEEQTSSKRQKIFSDNSVKVKNSPSGSTAMLLRGARALGIAAPYLSTETLQHLVHLLDKPRAYTRICACVVWSDSKLPHANAQLNKNLGPLPHGGAEFVEFKFHRDRLKALVSELCRNQNLPFVEPVTFESAIALLTDQVSSAQPALSQAILATKARSENECRALVSIINACAACALLSCQDSIPDKLNPIIKPLLKAVEKQRQAELQERSAKALGTLVHRCIGRPGAANNKLLQKLVGAATLMRDETPSEDREIELRGTRRAIQAICDACGTDLFSSLPIVYEMASCTMRRFRDGSSNNDWNSETNLASLFLEMQFLSLLLHYADQELIRSKIPELLPLVCHCLIHSSSSIRDQTAITLTHFCKADLVYSFEYVITNIVPLLSSAKNDSARAGASIAIHKCLSELGVLIVPYLAFIVSPLLARMTDPVLEIREIASLSFAAAVRLMPLESGVADPENMNPQLSVKRAENRAFISQLLDGTQIPDYKVPVKVKAELRRYQQEGVNWLSFLQRSNLHGIICDDMGLGKTLQTMCIVASCVAERRHACAEVLPTLVLCPSTLVHHWVFEIEKFCEPSDLTGFAYDGTSNVRASLRQHIFKEARDNVVVMSYNVWRSDLQYLQGIRFNYCILDEGHVIKNPKSRLTEAVKQIRANHRLVLSGTPVQNVVTDLWSIFDFLMPGYLGSFQYFNAKYSKPISLGSAAKATEKDQECSINALENLHKQVLPFLLRRVKEDVLDDLPEKIIQDYYCDLAPLQLELYDSFSKSSAAQEAQSDISYDQMKDSSPNDGAKHVFQVLQYLRKLITHPLLVLDQSHPEYQRVTAQLKQNKQSLHDLEFSPKLLALQQLLTDLNIGTQYGFNAVSQHRALVFAQFKSVLDIIEEDLFKRHMPAVTYLRMDGSLSPVERFEVVKKFNSDPSIDILLLTTHVGGLGLNLTGADTVIFMEHDWNPSKDLQAMDRAHRIGQTKVVNVFRLITRNTLEEKVMRLQKWKQSVANSVITQDNSSLRSMDTDQILDLMTVTTDKSKAPQTSAKSKTELDALGNVVTVTPGKTGMKAMLEGLQEMWDESQYEEEYNLDQFMKRLK